MAGLRNHWGYRVEDQILGHVDLVAFGLAVDRLDLDRRRWYDGERPRLAGGGLDLKGYRAVFGIVEDLAVDTVHEVGDHFAIDLDDAIDLKHADALTFQEIDHRHIRARLPQVAGELRLRRPRLEGVRIADELGCCRYLAQVTGGTREQLGRLPCR